MPEFSSVFPTLSPLPPLHLEFFSVWGIGTNLWTRLQWVIEFIPFAVLWSWWGLCPAPSSLGLVLSSAWTIQAYFCLAFPTIAVGFSTAIYRYFARHMLLASELPTLYEWLSLWAWILHRLVQWRIFLFIVWHCRAFGFSIAHLCFAFFFTASDICFHISGHTSSGREVVCFLAPRTMCILLVAFPLVERILWNLSMSLTIIFLHPRSSNLQYFSNNTSRDVHVVLVASMYFIGIRNDSSLGMYSLTLGSTWWR